MSASERLASASSWIAAYFDRLPVDAARQRLAECCASGRWVSGMLARRPFRTDAALLAAMHDAAAALSEKDWLEAFAAHPQIGDLESLRAKYASTRSLAAAEQQGAQAASEATLQELSTKNRLYRDKYGFIFIVFATGKSADEMLELLEQRLDNSRDEELQTAAEEQLKITELRLRKAAR